MEGFVTGDEDQAQYGLKVVFRKEASEPQNLSADNAGKYVVMVVFAQNMSRIIYDYEISVEDSSWGEITVRPYVIYATAKSKSDLYTGQKIELYGNDFNIIGGENGRGTQLVAGDTMTITPSALLAPPSASQIVTIASYEIVNSYGDNVNDNYLVYTSYVAEVMEEEGYLSADFFALLSYDARIVYYDQTTEIPQKTFEYTGKNIDINCPDSGIVTYVEGKGHGLMDGHTIQVRGIVPIILPEVYTDWAIIKIVDAKGNDVTKFYDARLNNAEDSKITVNPVNLTVTIKEGLTDEVLENAWNAYKTNGTNDGTVLITENNYKEGWIVLNPNLYKVSGLWEGQESEIVIVNTNEGLTLRVIVYETDARGNRIDKVLPCAIETVVRESDDFTKTVELSFIVTVQFTEND